MSWFSRWIRFNAVGAAGFAVQIASLTVLNRVTMHYLVATALAVEIALLHNFAWHVRYIWRDRTGKGGRWRQCFRFHLSNGAVSMAGNLAFMPLLLRGAGMPLVLANAIAVLACSVVNFLLANTWAFAHTAG